MSSNWETEDYSEEPTAPIYYSQDESDGSFVEPNWVRQMYGPPAYEPRVHQPPATMVYILERPAPATGRAPQPEYDDATLVYVAQQAHQARYGPPRPTSAALDRAESGENYDQKLKNKTESRQHLKDGRSSSQYLDDDDAIGTLDPSKVDPNRQPNRPSWTDAIRKRHQKQLRHFSKDVFGVPVPSTARPFSMFASSLQIGEACSGLGVYFSSIQAIIILALILMACYIYPVVDNATHQQWAEQYSLYLVDAVEESAVCAKGWDVSSWITEMTPGGHCASAKYSSSFDCAARCTWDPKRLKEPICQAQAMPDWYLKSGGQQNRSAACRQHLPCGSGRFDPAAPDGPCYCCDMVLDMKEIKSHDAVSTAQLWMFLVGQVFFLIWLLFLIHSQLRAVHTVGSRVLGVSDYSVLIKGIPSQRAADAPLAHWCAQYGSVVAAFNVPSVGDALRVGKRLSRLEVNKAESDALQGSTSCNPLQWLYKLIVVGNHGRLISTLDRERLKLKIYERQDNEPTGQGIATFEYTDSAAACVAEFDRPPIRRLLDASLCGCTQTTPRLHGAVVHLTRAPEPSDIIWEHTNCTGPRAFLRRLSSWLATAAIILLGAAVQYGIAVLANDIREDRMQSEYSLVYVSSDEALDHAREKAIRLRATSIVAAAMVVVVNLTIAVIIRKLSIYERWSTRSSMERWVMVKLALSQLINSFAIPVLATWASGNKASWYSRGGLSEAALMTQVGMAFIPPLMHLLAPGNLLNKYFLAKFARTQPMLDRLLAPPTFWLAEQHAAAVNTLGMAVLYAPMLPISPLIAAGGLTVAFWANKYFALRVAAAPGNLSGKVQSSLNQLLRVLPLVQLILMKHLYFKNHPSIDAVFYTGLTFWLLFMMAPIRACLGTFTKRRPALVSNGLGYHRLLGGAHSPDNVEVYGPQVPSPCSQKFKSHISEIFDQLAPAAAYATYNETEDVEPVKSQQQQGVAAGVVGHGTLRGSVMGGLREAFKIMWDPNQTVDLVEPPLIEDASAAGPCSYQQSGNNAAGLDHDAQSNRRIIPGSLRAQHSISSGGGRYGSMHSGAGSTGAVVFGGGAPAAVDMHRPIVEADVARQTSKRQRSPEPRPVRMNEVSVMPPVTAPGSAARERRRTLRPAPTAVPAQHDMVFSPLGAAMNFGD